MKFGMAAAPSGASDGRRDPRDQDRAGESDDEGPPPVRVLGELALDVVLDPDGALQAAATCASPPRSLPVRTLRAKGMPGVPQDTSPDFPRPRVGFGHIYGQGLAGVSVARMSSRTCAGVA